MNPNELKRLFPNASAATIKANCDKDLREASKLERHLGNESLEKIKVEKASPTKFIARITCHRHRLLDEDNTCVKFLVDTLRYSGLIPADDPETLSIQLVQYKIKKPHKEQVLVTIEAYE